MPVVFEADKTKNQKEFHIEDELCSAPHRICMLDTDLFVSRELSGFQLA